jgi:hypothetical protein
MYVLYYTSMLQCWHFVCVLVRTDHPCLGVGRHMFITQPSLSDSFIGCSEVTGEIIMT